MSKAYDFLKDCGFFYVLTVNGDFPAGRPFGAVMEYENDLYISTHDGNKAHEQLRRNGNVQIIAKKENSREWIRITGTADECTSIEMKQRMLDTCPIVSKHFPSADYEHFLLFRITVLETEFK